jgi:hypothetical protein
MARSAPGERELDALREAAETVVVIARREGNLLEVVGALDAPGRLTSLLHTRQQQPDQNGDDRDNH